MHTDQIMQFARAYSKLGWAVQAQADDIADGELDDLNPNAVREISKALRGFDEDLDAEIDRALAAIDEAKS